MNAYHATCGITWSLFAKLRNARKKTTRTSNNKTGLLIAQEQRERNGMVGKIEEPGYDRRRARRAVRGSRPPGELSMQGSAEEIGLSLVILSVVFACAALIRRWSRPLRKLFIPTAVIGGFLVLGLGPEGLGRLIGGSGLFPDNVFAV